MNRHFEAIVFTSCVLMTFLMAALPGSGEDRVPRSTESEPNYLGQYVAALIVTLIAVAIINRFRDSPINHWRAVMLTCGLVIVGNLVVVAAMDLRSYLVPEAYGALLADITTGGFLVLGLSWWFSSRYKRKRRSSEESES